MKKISYLKLFTTFFKINAITFGGGYTIVPVVRDVFVDDLKIIDEDEMMDIVALAQGGPGAMAISTSVLTGYRLKGPAGAITCLVASVLPCLIILSVISRFYVEFKENFFINACLDGISGAVAAVLLVTVYKMAKRAFKSHPRFATVLMAVIFLLGYFTDINTAILIIICAISGIAVFNRRN